MKLEELAEEELEGPEEEEEGEDEGEEEEEDISEGEDPVEEPVEVKDFYVITNMSINNDLQLVSRLLS